MYKTRFKGEVTVGAVHVVEDGAAGYGIWGRVTAREYVGGLACRGNCGTRTSCTRPGLMSYEGEATVGDVRVAEEGGGRLWSPGSL